MELACRSTLLCKALPYPRPAVLPAPGGSLAGACALKPATPLAPTRTKPRPEHGQQVVALASWRQAILDEMNQEEETGVSSSVSYEKQLALKIRIHAAGHTGRLDLTSSELNSLPPEVLDIEDLEELSLSGNSITALPDGISRLTSLKRLGLAGNSLTRLPEGIGALTALEGLWLHGNQLEHVPSSIGSLKNLRVLSLSGNCLSELPESLGGMTSLTELSVSGNQLSRVPDSLTRLTGLRLLALNGNYLRHMPAGLDALQHLDELMLQGNELEEVHSSIGGLKALRELSLADNRLASLPDSLTGLTALQKLYLYGNDLTHIQASSLAGLPNLASVWVEGNPLSAVGVRALVDAAATLPALKALGLDQHQAAHAPASAVSALGSRVRVGLMLGSGPGYFKLQYGSASTGASSADVGSTSHRHGTPDPYPPADTLVVAFGSAPGTPNWGGLLGKAYKAAADTEAGRFDVLYVVDPYRDWYGGGSDEDFERYSQRLEQYTQRYRHVIMLGDSMGATAALMYSRLATAVMAFCPQVGLESASIRPGRDAQWLSRLTARVLAAVEESGAVINTFTGTWAHDLDQVRLLPASRINSRVFSVDSHRLAAALDRRGKLLPVIQDCLAAQKGIRSGNVRLANML